MEMSEAAVLREVKGFIEANKLLAEGWQLLTVIARTCVEDEFQHTFYILGKPAEAKQRVPYKDML
ncbi:hypothetical protein [Pseudomonas sp. LD120]|uniref:hypothetical protein n=1 Tax=Pseudomonas sp. LD120 TaxID=485751 RepID=UPI00135A5F5A|nr:hypothetical protein [Pseudomonas sp. LD120]KAF0863978.1 hypothetical protein PLD_25380 [Pseudomonas sp. LD120]